MNAQQLGALALVFIGVNMIVTAIVGISAFTEPLAEFSVIQGAIPMDLLALLFGLGGLAVLIFGVVPGAWLVWKGTSLGERWCAVGDGELSLSLSPHQILTICLVVFGVTIAVEGLATLLSGPFYGLPHFF